MVEANPAKNELEVWAGEDMGMSSWLAGAPYPIPSKRSYVCIIAAPFSYRLLRNSELYFYGRLPVRLLHIRICIIFLEFEAHYGLKNYYKITCALAGET